MFGELESKEGAVLEGSTQFSKGCLAALSSSVGRWGMVERERSSGQMALERLGQKDAGCILREMRFVDAEEARMMNVTEGSGTNAIR